MADRLIRADPAARRQAVLLVLLGALAGTTLIYLFRAYRGPIQDWLLAEPAELARRIRIGFLLFALLLSGPLLAFAAYLWLLSRRIRQSRQFPPPGQRVFRDTTLIEGSDALARARVLRTLAVLLAAAALVLWLLLWQLAGTFGETAASRFG